MAETALVDLTAKNLRRRHYETIFIITPKTADKAVKELIEKNAKTVTDKNGKLLRQDDWGKKKMAYEVQKHIMGRYVYFRYTCTQDVVKDLERSLKLDASILKFKTVKLSDILTEEKENELVEKAPTEVTSAPAYRREDDHFDSRF